MTQSSAMLGWRPVKIFTAVVLSTIMAHMVIIPMIIEPAINFAGITLSKILYGAIASCFGAFLILIINNTLLFEGVVIDGRPKWSGWVVLSMLVTSIYIFATKRATVSSIALSISVLLLSGFVFFLVKDDDKIQRDKERSVDHLYE